MWQTIAKGDRNTEAKSCSKSHTSSLKTVTRLEGPLLALLLFSEIYSFATCLSDVSHSQHSTCSSVSESEDALIPAGSLVCSQAGCAQRWKSCCFSLTLQEACFSWEAAGLLAACWPIAEFIQIFLNLTNQGTEKSYRQTLIHRAPICWFTARGLYQPKLEPGTRHTIWLSHLAVWAVSCGLPACALAESWKRR